MSRRAGGFRGAKPTWTTTSTPGVFGLSDVVDLKAAGQWPRGPAAPTNLAATAGNAQVALTWTAPATTHGTITDYEVQYSSDGGVTWYDVNTPLISISTQPSNQTAVSGAATFSVTATVTLGATLSYQWQKQESGAGAFANVNGANSASLSLSSLTNANDNGDVYRCVVSATGGAESVTSSTATLTVAPDSPPLAFKASYGYYNNAFSALVAGNAADNTYSLTGTGAAGNPVSLVIGGSDEHMNTVWLEITQTGTLNWSVHASSEPSWDYGHLYFHPGPYPGTVLLFAEDNVASSPFVSLSGPRSGTQSASGSRSVSAGQFLVFQYRKDESGMSGSDTVTLSASIP